MRSVEEKRNLLKNESRVQVERDGTRKTGVLKRLGGRPGVGRGLNLRLNLRAHLAEAGWSLAAFVSGLGLASLYGLTALVLQQQPLWFCVYTTVTLAGLAAVGMGLSAGVRADVMVMLPSMCSARGRSFLLLLFMSVLLSGPVSNTLQNTDRVASSLLCGAELAANQTQELLQRAATPLFSVLDDIREISRNAHAVAGRVQNFINALEESVRHVARTLRNVLHFLVDIGDVCNAKLGTPYRKCRQVFTEARSDCSDLLGDFSFLCDVVSSFMPLCQLARAGELFCTIPSYIAQHLKQRLADPTVAAFRKMMEQFEFNISASVNLDLDLNSSRSLRQVSQDIMREVSSDLQMFQWLSEPLVYSSLFLLGWSFLRAVLYRRRYLRTLSFDNIYITAQFQELDQQLSSGGGASVLPLSRRERQTYISPLSFQLSGAERRSVVKGVSSVLRHLLMGVLLVGLDFLLFWILDQVQHQLKGDVVARAPVLLAVQVDGSGYASDVFRDLVSSFNVLQGGNVTVISRKCLLEPSEPDYTACFLLDVQQQMFSGSLCAGFLLGLALLVSLTGGLVQRCRRLVCAFYHPEREQERILFLHQQILDQRTALGRALRRSVVRNQADREDGGGRGGGGGGGRGGRGGESLLQTLLTRFPGAAHLSRLLGPSSGLTCLACGEELRAEDADTVTCDVPRCSGSYCQPCFLSLGRTCGVCLRPLTFQEDGDEELDSSDDEQLSLWSAALASPRISGAGARRLMEAGIAMATPPRDTAQSQSDSELSELDMTYQDRSGSDSDSDSDTTFHSALSEALDSVLVHRHGDPVQAPPLQAR